MKTQFSLLPPVKKRRGAREEEFIQQELTEGTEKGF